MTDLENLDLESETFAEDPDFGMEIYIHGVGKHSKLNDDWYNAYDQDPGPRMAHKGLGFRRFTDNLSQNRADGNRMHLFNSPYIENANNDITEIVDPDRIDNYTPGDETALLGELLARGKLSKLTLEEPALPVVDEWLEGFLGPRAKLKDALDESKSRGKAHYALFGLNMPYETETNPFGKPMFENFLTRPSVQVISDEETISTIYNHVNDNPDEFYDVLTQVSSSYDIPNFEHHILGHSEQSGEILTVECIEGGSEETQYDKS